VVREDPDARDHRQFREIFPEREQVILLFEADDPYAPAVLQRVGAIEARLAALPHVAPFSALSLYARARPGAAGAAADPAAFRAFALGTRMLRRQGLVGDDFLGMPVRLDVEGAHDRDAALRAIDAALAADLAEPGPLRAIRRVGGPYLDAWIEQETARASGRAFPALRAVRGGDHAAPVPIVADAPRRPSRPSAPRWPARSASAGSPASRSPSCRRWCL